MSGVAKWMKLGLEVFERYQASMRERDPMAGKTVERRNPPTRRVDHGVQVEYSPDIDGDADPGEVVWAWVPFEDDETRGKDRPVVIIGRASGRLAGVPLTSKNKGRNDHVPVGTGDWDPKRRDSYAKVDRLLMLDDHDVRREGAVLARARFDDVVGNLERYHELARSGE